MRAPKLGRPSATAVEEMRRNSAQYCNSLSIACFVIGVLTPIVRMSESGAASAADTGLMDRVAAHLGTGPGITSLVLFAMALLFRLRSLYMLWPIKDAKSADADEPR